MTGEDTRRVYHTLGVVTLIDLRNSSEAQRDENEEREEEGQPSGAHRAIVRYAPRRCTDPSRASSIGPAKMRAA